MTTDNPHHARRWWILAVLGIAQLMVVLDATIVNIALPSAQQALGFSDDNRQWIVTAYALAFGSLLLLGGRLGDLFGRKRVVHRRPGRLRGRLGARRRRPELRACSSPPARCRAPSARCSPRPRSSLLTTTFTEPGRARQGVRHLRRDRRRRRRGRPAARRRAHRVPVAGAGACTSTSLFAVPAAIGRARAAAQPGRRRSAPTLDIPGTITASAGLFALVYGFSHAETHGWGDPLTIGFLAAGVVLLAAFVVDPAPRRRTRCCRCASSLDRNRGGAYLADRHRRRRHVRRLPVPHLLPAADARLLADQDRPRVPADDRP